MSTFIKSSVCKGKKPRQLHGIPFFMRNGLLARMMRDRTHVRYLVAPTGCGKTVLAGSYAQVVNGYEHTLWISAQNPCFLRDLDANVLTKDILSESHPGDVIVFDDMPAMDKRRTRNAWSMCYRLLNSGREVLVCTTPSCHPFRTHLKSCTVIQPTDFIFRDDDFDDLRGMAISTRALKAPSSPSDRIPCLALGNHGSYEQFLTAHIEDVDDMRHAGISFVLLVLAKGTLEDAAQVVGEPLTQRDISADFLRPFITYDEFSTAFDASDYPMREVARAYSPYINRVAHALGYQEAGMLVMRLADMLLKKQSLDRAVQILRLLALPAVRALWLRKNQTALLDGGALMAGEVLYDSLRGTRYWKEPALMCASALRRRFLGDDAAQEDLQRIACREDMPVAIRAQAAAVAFLLASKTEAGAIFEAIAPQMLSSENSDEVSDQVRELGSLWYAMKHHGDVSCAQQPLSLAVQVRAMALKLLPEDKAAQCARTAEGLLQKVQKDTRIDSATILLRRVFTSDVKASLRPAGAMRATAKLAAAFDDNLETQRVAYGRYLAARTTEEAHQRMATCTHHSSGSLPRIPYVRVTLFGQFRVTRDDVPLEDAGFRRSKVRLLLALLLLENGRDFSTEHLGTKMWPDSVPARARHNLHATTSLLRHCLMLPGGECPYLRVQMGLMGLDTSLISSDVADIEKICRKLRFDEPDPDMFLHMLEQVRSLCAGELLPGENNSLILAARRALNSKLVASLMTAAHRLAEVHADAVALQLAQQALDTDPSREDCYEFLMSLQAALGQRPAAIDTWFSYCRYVDDELGLEPSTRVKDLYSRIINDQLVAQPVL